MRVGTKLACCGQEAGCMISITVSMCMDQAIAMVYRTTVIGSLNTNLSVYRAQLARLEIGLDLLPSRCAHVVHPGISISRRAVASCGMVSKGGCKQSRRCPRNHLMS